MAAWEPYALVLDLRELRYEWGDGRAAVLGAWPLPVGVVASGRNRVGLATLVRDELSDDPSDWLFESVGAAVDAVARRLAREPDPPNGSR